MSLHNKNTVTNFIQSNVNLLVILDKFKGLTINDSIDSFINRMKITIEDMKSFIKTFESVKVTIMKNRFDLINASTSFNSNDDDQKIVNDVRNIPATNKFFDLQKDSNKIKYRNGTMSFSICSNNIRIKKVDCGNEACYKPDDEDENAIVSMNPIYYSVNMPKLLGRITFFTNDYNLTLLNFYSQNYYGRQQFRREITSLILGKDFYTKIINNNINIDEGFFGDKTIGQEIYYYFFEIYNYDRFNFFNKSFEQIQNIPGTLDFNDYETNKTTSDYPALDGIIYFDNTKYENVNYPGPEVVIFSAEIKLSITGFITSWNNKYYDVKDKDMMKDDFISFIENGLAFNKNVLTPCKTRNESKWRRQLIT